MVVALSLALPSLFVELRNCLGFGHDQGRICTCVAFEQIPRAVANSK